MKTVLVVMLFFASCSCVCGQGRMWISLDMGIMESSLSVSGMDGPDYRLISHGVEAAPLMGLTLEQEFGRRFSVEAGLSYFVYDLGMSRECGEYNDFYACEEELASMYSNSYGFIAVPVRAKLRLNIYRGELYLVPYAGLQPSFRLHKVLQEGTLSREFDIDVVKRVPAVVLMCEAGMVMEGMIGARWKMGMSVCGSLNPFGQIYKERVNGNGIRKSDGGYWGVQLRVARVIVDWNKRKERRKAAYMDGLITVQNKH